MKISHVTQCLGDETCVQQVHTCVFRTADVLVNGQHLVNPLGVEWLVAVLAFVVIGMLKPDLEIAWICYVYAIPVSFIVLVVFSALWGKKWVKFITITGLIWTLLLSIYLSITIFDDSAKSAWMIFLIGIPVEVAFLFFFLLKKKSNL